jgi:hypothetical protein
MVTLASMSLKRPSATDFWARPTVTEHSLVKQMLDTISLIQISDNDLGKVVYAQCDDDAKEEKKKEKSLPPLTTNLY